MKLNAKAFALSNGIVWGVLVFLVTNIQLLRESQGEHLSLLANLYPGYSFSFIGSLIGFLWGFVSMFVTAWIIAWLYNKLAVTQVPQA